MGKTGEKDEKPPKDRRQDVCRRRKFRENATPRSKYKVPTSGLEEYIYE